jgi:3-hydroxybutyryl-CoA dehydrogenase
MDVKNVAVVGGGTMGNGIAHVFALSGFDVMLIDLKQNFIDRAMATIKKNLERQAQKGTIEASDVSKALGRIRTSTCIDEVRIADLAVEAVFEKIEPKTEIFKKFNVLCRPDTIMASNTSSLPITRIGAITNRPDKVVGMHFMNPVPMMKLVEMIRGLATSDDTMKTAIDVANRLGKTPVEVNDYPGFSTNRLLMPMINEAVYCLMEGVASKESIDTCMRLGMNHPMGPLTLADFIGLDVCLDIMNVLHDGFSDPKYRPCPLLRKMVQAGYLGRKTGRGFYIYDNKT